MKLLAVLLNWRTPDMTLKSLRALAKEIRRIDGAHICVVDNDSQDGSFEKISAAVVAEGFSDITDVVQSGHNGGFGFGNNVGLRRGLAAGAEYLYLINSDAFVQDNAVTALVEHLDTHADVGIAGSSIFGSDGRPHETAFRFPTLWSEIDRGLKLGPVTKLLEDKIVPMPIPDTDAEVDWLAGASIMFRREVLERVGLFDETFFLYYEETDLCLRARRAGYKAMYVKASVVEHIGSATTGMNDTKRPMPKYMFESRRYYFLKNHGRGYLWACNAAFIASTAAFRLRRKLQNKPDPDRPNEFRDFVRFNLKNP